eukprot:CAMPEP_0174362502 /NCGR_PEP_ID=MMETSP0811_2-20130205/64651_1 /TAXON_ID=73025 ORGANISM="Eutreptiella gymnastica-like, Strain CCMP1594" /NCGR_SAMPLE_ID=MMETSP0811_2 /ASSEMBLY_ACC=CAM_ASM_000667 /LENGTH=174 /DNA_ID=CAMNT_0015500257 /DNA_START=436 /DNA_END=960 /DNA_ORIENTATION=+
MGWRQSSTESRTIPKTLVAQKSRGKRAEDSGLLGSGECYNPTSMVVSNKYYVAHWQTCFFATTSCVQKRLVTTTGVSNDHAPLSRTEDDLPLLEQTKDTMGGGAVDRTISCEKFVLFSTFLRLEVPPSLREEGCVRVVQPCPVPSLCGDLFVAPGRWGNGGVWERGTGKGQISE